VNDEKDMLKENIKILEKDLSETKQKLMK